MVLPEGLDGIVSLGGIIVSSNPPETSMTVGRTTLLSREQMVGLFGEEMAAELLHLAPPVEEDGLTRLDRATAIRQQQQQQEEQQQQDEQQQQRQRQRVSE